MESFEDKLRALDLRLFERIESLLSDNDRQSLLACQIAVRELVPEYTYLEIGSFRGGSLQPYVLDENCRAAYSIDKRPPVAPDSSGVDAVYSGNTTAAMLDNLKAVSESGVRKIICLEGDVSEIDPASVEVRPDICFIDGEHTDDAVLRDFEFCRQVMAENGALVFHDSEIIYNPLLEVIKRVEASGTPFRAYNLADFVFVIEMGDFPMHRSKHIHERLLNNYVGYLNSMRFTDPYRTFAMRPLFRFIRNIKYKFVSPKYE